MTPAREFHDLLGGPERHWPPRRHRRPGNGLRATYSPSRRETIPSDSLVSQVATSATLPSPGSEQVLQEPHR